MARSRKDWIRINGYILHKRLEEAHETPTPEDDTFSEANRRKNLIQFSLYNMQGMLSPVRFELRYINNV